MRKDPAKPTVSNPALLPPEQSLNVIHRKDGTWLIDRVTFYGGIYYQPRHFVREGATFHEAMAAEEVEK